MNYIGDFAVGQEIYIWFNTFSSNDPTASVTMTTFIDTDVHIHKDDSLTQRNNAAGVAVDVDVDGIAGVHKITIQTADNTVADFYEAGHDYAVRIEGATVDAALINPVVGTFSIANRRVAGEMCRSSIEAVTSQTVFTLTTGEASGDDDAYNFCTAIITDQVTRIQKAKGFISDYTGSTRTVTLIADPGIFTMAVGDSVEILATSALANIQAWLGTAVTLGNSAPDVNVASIDADAITASALATDAGDEIADQVWDEAKAGHVGAGGFGEEVQSHSLEATVAALNDLSAANVNTEVDTALNTAIPGSPTAGSINEVLQRVGRSADMIQEYTVDNTSFTATTTAAQVDAVSHGTLEASDDHFNGRVMFWTSGANIYQATDITDYDGTNKRFTYTALTDTPADNDTFILI